MASARSNQRKRRQAQKVAELYWWKQLSITEACRQAGVSKATYYRWLRRWPEVAADYERARAIRWRMIDDRRFEIDARRLLRWPALPAHDIPREISPRKVFHPCAHVKEWNGVKVTRHGRSEVFSVKQRVFDEDQSLFRVAGLTLGSTQYRYYVRNSMGNLVALPMK